MDSKDIEIHTLRLTIIQMTRYPEQAGDLGVEEIAHFPDSFISTCQKIAAITPTNAIHTEYARFVMDCKEVQRLKDRRQDCQQDAEIDARITDDEEEQP